MFTEKGETTFAQCPNEILVRCLQKNDFAEWNQWRDTANKGPISLKGAGLSNANLAGTDLSQVDLRMADLKNADLSGADLSGADLAGADLSHANLFDADLWKADLKFANLWRANLKRAQLQMANLENAELVEINLESADLWKTNLKGAKFISIVVDRRTFIWNCDFDEQTVLIGEGLSQARIEPRLMEHIKKYSVGNRKVM